MSTKNKAMNMTVQTESIDVDSLIEGADPISARIHDKKLKEKADHKNEVKAPWKDLPNKGKISMPLYISPETKKMLDFLRDETGVPSQVLLRKIIEPAIRKEAETVFKKNA